MTPLWISVISFSTDTCLIHIKEWMRYRSLYWYGGPWLSKGVSHSESRLLCRLRAVGVAESFIKWFDSYLTCMNQTGCIQTPWMLYAESLTAQYWGLCYVKSKMAAAKKQSFLRFLYLTESSPTVIQSPQFTNDNKFGISVNTYQ